MAVNEYIDFAGATKLESRFVPKFKDWLSDGKYNTDWRAQKLEKMNINQCHIHQGFIDLWILECEPTKAQIIAGENLLRGKNQLKTQDLISVFKKELKNSGNVKLAPLVEKVEARYTRTHKKASSKPEVSKNAVKHEANIEDIPPNEIVTGKHFQNFLILS